MNKKFKKIVSALTITQCLTLYGVTLPVYADEVNYNINSDMTDIGSLRNANLKVTDSYISINGLKIFVKTNTQRGQVVLSAVSKLGCPYAWGGEGAPWSGNLTTGDGGKTEWKDSNYDYDSRIGMSSYDCSGFIMKCMQDVGIDLPHFSGGQCSTEYGGVIKDTKNGIANLQPGDIAGDDNHVVMYLGGGYIIEAPQTGKTIRIISLKERFGEMKFPTSYTVVSYFGK